MLEQTLRQKLIDALMRLPGIDESAASRTVLLAGIPNSAFFTRNRESVRGDLSILILQLEENFSSSGQWRLLTLVDNALPAVQGTDLGRDLLAIRQELEAFRLQPAQADLDPADYAATYRFDLYKNVMACLALLPDRPRLSFFLIPCHSPRLLANFCESLRYRGAQTQLWAREAVAFSRPLPIQIEISRGVTVQHMVDKANGLAGVLDTKTVVMAVRVPEEQDVADLCQGLAAVFPDSLPHHLIVVLGTDAHCRAPQDVHVLPSPQFNRSHVAAWVSEIVKALLWPQDLAPHWEAQIVESIPCTNDVLDIDEVYTQLEEQRRLLQQYRTEQAFRQALQEMQEGAFYVG